MKRLAIYAMALVCALAACSGHRPAEPEPQNKPDSSTDAAPDARAGADWFWGRFDRPFRRRTPPVITNPNVVEVLLDDADMNSFQVALAAGFLPNISSFMLDGGTQFSESYAVNPWCCPSRASEQSGLHSHNCGTFHNNNGYSAWLTWEASNVSLAENLFARGYWVERIGKWLNGYNSASNEPPRGFSRWVGMLNVDTSYDMTNYVLRICEAATGSGVSCPGAGAYTTESPGFHQMDKVSDRVVARIAAMAEPFAYFVSPTVPHVEHNAPGSYSDRELVRQFRAPPPARHAGDARNDGQANGFTPLGGLGGALDLPGCVTPASGSFDEVDISDKAAWLRLGINNDGEMPRITDGCASVTAGSGSVGTGGELRLMWLDYLEQWKGIDDFIGALRDALQARGILNRTVVILTSDNGYLFGEHRTTLKMSGFEESIRVPLMVRGPGIRSAATRTEPVANIDLATTIVELTGGGTSYVTDGRSLVGMLRDAAAPVGWRKTLLFEHWYADRTLPADPWDLPDMVSIKAFTGHACAGQKLIGYMPTGAAPYAGTQNNTPFTQLANRVVEEQYDLGPDPHELDSVLGDGPYAACRTQLEAEMVALATCSPTGTTCRSLED